MWFAFIYELECSSNKSDVMILQNEIVWRFEITIKRKTLFELETLAHDFGSTSV